MYLQIVFEYDSIIKLIIKEQYSHDRMGASQFYKLSLPSYLKITISTY